MEMEKEEFGLSPLKTLVQIGPLQKKLHNRFILIKIHLHPEKDWRTHANTPGHAIQFNEGIFKGRIYVPANHSTGNPQSWI